MSSEILIVGDASRRRELITKVRDCGYEVVLAGASDVHNHMQRDDGVLPVALIVCMDDVAAAELLASLRRSRPGANVPVLLHASLRDEPYDLADLLDLGADHIVVEPVDFAGLRQALFELAGPPWGRRPGQPLREPSPADSGLWLERAGLGGPDSIEQSAPNDRDARAVRSDADLSAGLDDTASQSGDRLELELASMGMDVIPDVEPEGETLDADDPQTHLGLHTNYRSARRSNRRVLKVATPNPADKTNEIAAVAGETTRGTRVGPTDGETKILDTPRVDARAGDDLSRMAARVLDQQATPHEYPTSAKDHTEALEMGGVAVGHHVRSDYTREESFIRSAAPGHGPEVAASEWSGAFGRLIDVEVPRLLWALHVRAFDGVLEIAGPMGVKRLAWQHGVLVGSSSSCAGDQVTAVLQAKGWLTRADVESLAVYDAKTAEDPQVLLRLIAKQGILKPREVAVAGEAVLLHVAGTAMTWRTGTWRLMASDWLVESASLRIAPLRALASAALRYLDVRHVQTWLHDYEMLPQWSDGEPRVHLATLAAAAELPLADFTWLLASDGVTSLANLAGASPMRESALVWCYILHVIGALRLPLRVQVDARVDAVEIDRQRIAERLSLARESNYFALLGLTPTANELEVRRAGSDLLALFSPQALEPESLERFAAEIVEVRAAIQAATELLADEHLRRAYGAHWRA